MKSEKKQEFEAIKKTAEAHGTLSEEVAEERASKIQEITEDLIENGKDEPLIKIDIEEPKEEKTEEQKDKERGLSATKSLRSTSNMPSLIRL